MPETLSQLEFDQSQAINAKKRSFLATKMKCAMIRKLDERGRIISEALLPFIFQLHRDAMFH